MKQEQKRDAKGREFPPEGRLCKTPEKFPRLAQALVQSLFIAGFLFIAFLLVYHTSSKLAVASLAASTFIAFGFPNAESGRPKYLVGGYASATVCGFACSLVFHALPGGIQQSAYFQIAFCALAVFVTAFLMLALKLQHPPAAALAVSLVLEPSPWGMGGIAMACIVALSIIKVLVNRWLATRCD